MTLQQNNAMLRRCYVFRCGSISGQCLTNSLRYFPRGFLLLFGFILCPKLDSIRITGVICVPEKRELTEFWTFPGFYEETFRSAHLGQTGKCIVWYSATQSPLQSSAQSGICKDIIYQHQLFCKVMMTLNIEHSRTIMRSIQEINDYSKRLTFSLFYIQ